MSYGKAFTAALGRSLEVVRDGAASVMRLEVNPGTATKKPIHLFSIKSQKDLDGFATGSDKDIGGLSDVKLGVDEGHGRFFGTLSNQLPRNAPIQRTGYAGMRTRNRPTLFGTQTWDTSLHSYLALRVRNSLFATSPRPPAPPSPLSQIDASPGDRSSLNSGRSESFSSLTPQQRARAALGHGMDEPLGPKFFANIQTDGPVTSDLFQHRIWLDPAAGDEWQTIVIPFDRFLMLNTGTLADSQIKMMRQAVRTVGISCILEAPRPPGPDANAAPAEKSDVNGAPSALRGGGASITQAAEAAEAAPREGEDDWGRDGTIRPSDQPDASPLRGLKRGQSFRFDLGLMGAKAVGSVEEALELEW